VFASTESAKNALLVSFGVGATLNFVTVLAGLDGWAWTALRVAVSPAFTVALVAWLVGAVKGRRGAGHNHRHPS
jgi:hypothetical protein